jgi:DNA-binding response OmpR family regulator
MMILPLLDTVMSANAGPAATPAPATAAAARVMIVDDHADGMESLGALLAAQGHDVLMAEDGAGALRIAASRAIDVFILDIGLPDMPGYELARRLRATDSGRRALMIALTGYGQAQDRLLSNEAGFNHHFVKPVDIDALSALLHQAQTRNIP